MSTRFRHVVDRRGRSDLKSDLHVIVAERLIERSVPSGVTASTTAANKQADFVSRRVGNFQYNLRYGMLLDQLWVK